MVTLPFPPRRSHLRAFWLGLNVGGLAVAALAGLTLGSPQAVLVVSVLVAGTLAAGLIWTDGPLFLYRGWNKAADVVAAIGRWWVLAIIHYLVFAVVGRAGSRLDLAPSRGSMWRPYARSVTANGTPEPRVGWVRRFAREGRGRGRGWWIPIMPLLLILSLFVTDTADEDIPSNVYTLY